MGASSSVPALCAALSLSSSLSPPPPAAAAEAPLAPSALASAATASATLPWDCVFSALACFAGVEPSCAQPWQDHASESVSAGVDGTHAVPQSVPKGRREIKAGVWFCTVWSVPEALAAGSWVSRTAGTRRPRRSRVRRAPPPEPLPAAGCPRPPCLALLWRRPPTSPLERRRRPLGMRDRQCHHQESRMRPISFRGMNRACAELSLGVDFKLC